MIEEVSMDKKSGNRSVQAPTKGSGTELKKPQDAQANTKQLPRGSRKREPSGSNGFKFDQNRKPAPQKSKAIDKRPRSRGTYNGSGKENTQVGYDGIQGEFGSLFSGGSKKQNLNHLLNFHYEPRCESKLAVRQQHYKSSYGTKALMATQAHKYNKEQFLQANCQFVVHVDGDYSPYMVDPDILVDWDLVEMIRVWSNENITCPICLYPPIAGKITRCGHVFCWSCILHYLALSDKTWRKCPICYEAVHKNDLKSVECIEHTVCNVGQKITLQLMKREKGSLITSPVSQYDNRIVKSLLEVSESCFDTVFSKLLLATYNDIMKIIDREQKELNTQLEESKGYPELCFVEQAIELLSVRKQKYEQKIGQGEINEDGNLLKTKDVEMNVKEPNVVTSNYVPDSADSLSRSPTDNAKFLERERLESLSSEGDEPTNVRAEDLYIGTDQTNNQPVKYFYFYQAIDGQQIYLHAINVRMLEMSYGSLEHCPHTITGSIVEKESGSMTAELRRRLRYLQHVPITCQFEVVEIALAPPLISSSVAHFFTDQVEQRKRKRAKHAREERKREKRIEESERRLLGRGPTPKIRIESHYHFPQCGFTEALPPSTPQVQSEESSRASSPLSLRQSTASVMSGISELSFEETPALAITPSSSEDTGPSFAQMLRDGKSMRPTGDAWPTVDNKKGGWGQPSRQRARNSAGESDSETYLSTPPTKPSFSIAEALENVNIDGFTDSSSGKKKKKKPKVLFSTGMACTGK